MPRLRVTSPWRFILLTVLLVAALAPACLRVFSVAHTARWMGACLPSQGTLAESVRLGLQAHKQVPAGHHGGACEVCGVCPALGDVPLVAAKEVMHALAQFQHQVPVGDASAVVLAAAGDVALARGPPQA